MANGPSIARPASIKVKTRILGMREAAQRFRQGLAGGLSILPRSLSGRSGHASPKRKGAGMNEAEFLLHAIPHARRLALHTLALRALSERPRTPAGTLSVAAFERLIEG